MQPTAVFWYPGESRESPETQGLQPNCRKPPKPGKGCSELDAFLELVRVSSRWRPLN